MACWFLFWLPNDKRNKNQRRGGQPSLDPCVVSTGLAMWEERRERFLAVLHW